MKIATIKDIKVGDTLICLIEEYAGQGEDAFDATVMSKNENGVDLCYLSGYKSRNDFVTWDKILAKVDKRRRYVTLKDAHYSGHFEVFNTEVEPTSEYEKWKQRAYPERKIK